MLVNQNGNVYLEHFYLGGGLFERDLMPNGEWRNLCYVYTPAGLSALVITNETTREDELYFVQTDYQGSIMALLNPLGQLVEEYSYDPWGNRRDPDTWQNIYTNSTQPSFGGAMEGIFYRGYTGHEHLDCFALINMNGRMYDPVLGRMLSPDNFLHTDQSTQGLNRYAYTFNNPLKYTDPNGENPFLAIFIGAMLNTAIQAHTGNLNNIWAFAGAAVIGGAAGYLGMQIALGVQTAMAGASFWAPFVGSAQGVKTIIAAGYSSSFINGALVGAAGGFASGFVNGFSNSLASGVNFPDSFKNGLKMGVTGGFSGAAIGGVFGGINASKDGRNFWDGSKVYKSPIKNNFGNTNGECALRCFEEFSDSYQKSEFDYEYWLDRNGGLGVTPSDVECLIENGSFSSERLAFDPSEMAKAISENKRIMMGFRTSNGNAHAVMVKKIKIHASGGYKIFFAETSPVRLAPLSTSNYFKDLPGAGFWTFYLN